MTYRKSNQQYWIEPLLLKFFFPISFAGNRFAPPDRTLDQVLIYDRNGIIAGIQNVVPRAPADAAGGDFHLNEFYALDSIFDTEVKATILSRG